jgi:hypothetical protein
VTLIHLRTVVPGCVVLFGSDHGSVLAASTVIFPRTVVPEGNVFPDVGGVWRHVLAASTVIFPRTVVPERDVSRLGRSRLQAARPPGGACVPVLAHAARQRHASRGRRGVAGTRATIARDRHVRRGLGQDFAQGLVNHASGDCDVFDRRHILGSQQWVAKAALSSVVVEDNGKCFCSHRIPHLVREPTHSTLHEGNLSRERSLPLGASVGVRRDHQGPSCWLYPRPVLAVIHRRCKSFTSQSFTKAEVERQLVVTV